VSLYRSSLLLVALQGWVHYFTGLMTSQSSAQQQQQQVQQEQLQQQQQQLRRSQSELMQQQWKVDRRVGCISIAMWLGTAVRVWSFLSLWENMQSVVAMSTSRWTGVFFGHWYRTRRR
jgi:uncharacterized membrane protein (DUF106 family)